jgi:hypothetical protein
VAEIAGNLVVGHLAAIDASGFAARITAAVFRRQFLAVDCRYERRLNAETGQKPGHVITALDRTVERNHIDLHALMQPHPFVLPRIAPLAPRCPIAPSDRPASKNHSTQWAALRRRKARGA